jgi:AcrR family transcriptional regulator
MADAASAASAPKVSRLDRRKARTRRALIDAAARLIAEGRGDRASIQEITDEADIGFGSFYNHFESKEAIVEAVLGEEIAAQGTAVQSVTAGLNDPAEIVAVAHRYFVNRAWSDPDWGWLLIHLDLSQKISLEALGPFARQDLERGIRAGRFRVPNVRVALFATGGALLGVMRDVLDGHAPKDADRHHAEGVLRMLGLAVEDAAEVARRPMPKIPNQKR